MPFSVKQIQHIAHRLLSPFFTILRELIVCFQATLTLLTNPHYVCKNLRYHPFFLNIDSPFLFPQIAGIDTLDCLHKHHNFL